MKKRLLALLCVLAILAGMFVVPVSAADSQSEDTTYQVGYAKRDINPWVELTIDEKGTTIGIPAQYTDADGNTTAYTDDYIVNTQIHNPLDLTQVIDQPIVSVKMGGYGNGDTRRALLLSDDNGDGYISYGDGMYITCTSVTDSNGTTVLYLTIDITGAGSTAVGDMRTEIVKALGTSVIAESRIMVSANHSHSGASLSKATVGTATRAYYDYVIQQAVDAASEAYNTRSNATMSKGSIEASNSMKKMGYVDENNGGGAKLNFVRHYTSQGNFQYRDATNGITSWTSLTYTGESNYFTDLIRTAHSGATCFPSLADHSETYKSYIQLTGHVSEVDETLHVLKFDREDGDPVVMINWRAHSTLNGAGSWYNISGDYANSLRYRLENNKTLFGGDTNYCVAFWQGASGNVNANSSLDGGSNTTFPYDENIWKQDIDDTAKEVKVKWAELEKNADGNITAVTVSDDPFYQAYYNMFETLGGDPYNNAMYYCSKYGYLLAKVALDCLKNNMEECDTGAIYTKQVNFQYQRQQYSYGQYLAAKEWEAAGRPSGNTVFPYWYDADLDKNGVVERYILNSKFHATSVLSDYPSLDPDLDGTPLPLEQQTQASLELNVITLGSDVAMVVIPGEPFDRYSDDYIKASATGSYTWEELFAIAIKDNDWEDLINNDTYGTPFVLGYSNATPGYLANALAYDYLSDLDVPLDKNGDPLPIPQVSAGDYTYTGTSSGRLNAAETAYLKAYYSGYYNVYAPGSYESNTGNMERGGGEAVIDKLQDMLASITDAPRTAVCAACGKEVEWTALAADELGTTMTTGHYYLTEDATTVGSNYQHSIGVSGGTESDAETVCLDLNGMSWTHNGRIFVIYAYSTLNIMDSAGGGIITAKSGSYSTIGGMMRMYEDSSFSLYSGTLKFEKDDAYLANIGSPNKVTYSGGVIYCDAGTISVYGGTIQGGEVGLGWTDDSQKAGGPYISSGTCQGGTIRLRNTSNLCVYGGQILAGKAAQNPGNVYTSDGTTLAPDGVADCVIASYSSKVTLAGNARVDDIYCEYEHDNLTVSGNYTGQTNVQFAASVTLKDSQIVGAVEDTAAIKAGTLTYADTSYKFAACDGSLMLFSDNIAAAVGTTGYTTVAKAINAYSEETSYVKLLKDVTSVSVSKAVYMDLNGYSIDSVTSTSGGVLHCLDTQTDDYVIEGDASTGYSGYGVVGSFVEGTVAAVTVDDGWTMNGYAMIKEDKGTSFHCVNLQLTHMSMKPKVDGETEYNPSLYYKSAFAGDALVADNVNTFGVALSTVEVPNASNMGVTNKYSWFEGAEFEPGENSSEATSTLLYGVMKETNGPLTNQVNASRPVFGRAYIKLADGQYVFGISASRTLKQQVEDIDTNWSSYTDAQREAVVNMYNIYQKIMKKWDIPNIKTAAAA